MKLLFILFGVIFCLLSVNGRNLHDHNENEEYSEEESVKQNRDPTAKQMRHRRLSRQLYHGYKFPDYRPDYNWQQDDSNSQIIRLLSEIASNSRYPTRDYNRQQEETYSQILKLLDEIVSKLNRPAPPPQPIYVPYPVPYPVPQSLNCANNFQPQVNSTPNRFPDLEDDRQNFGLIPGEVDTGDSDGIRPISFDPIPPRVPVAEALPVEHGTVQAGMNTPKPTQPKKPGLCKAAVLTCCNLKNNEEQKSCFLKYDCRRTFETGLACRPEVIKKVLEEFSEAYAPMN